MSVQLVLLIALSNYCLLAVCHNYVLFLFTFIYGSTSEFQIAHLMSRHEPYGETYVVFYLFIIYILMGGGGGGGGIQVEDCTIARPPSRQGNAKRRLMESFGEERPVMAGISLWWMALACGSNACSETSIVRHRKDHLLCMA